MRRVIFFAFLFAFGFTIAESGQSHPTPMNSASQPRSNPTNTQTKPNSGLDAPQVRPVEAELINAPGTRVEAASKKEGSQNFVSHEWWLVYLTAALAITTLALAAFTALLWKSTGNLVKGAEDTAKRQLRAYVWIEFSESDDVLLQREMASANIKNTGLTPAHNVHAWSYYEIVEEPLPADFIFAEAPEEIIGPRFPVNPQSSHNLTLRAELISDADRVLISEGKKLIYVFGEIRYEDVFGGKRYSKYRLCCIKNRSHSGWSWRYCDGGNEAK